MPYLLNFVYLAVMALAAPWLILQAIFRGKYREGFAAKFLGSVPRRDSVRPCIWFHAVSVGEVNLLGVLLREAARRPDVECVISTTTMTGYALARQKYAEHQVFYCPLDFSWAVRRAMKRIQPTLLVLAELELWPNLVRAAKERGTRVAIVNGRLSEKSFRGYKRIKPVVRRTLDRIDLAAAQNEIYAVRFQALGMAAERIAVTGSLKFDGATSDRMNPLSQRLRRLAGFGPDDVVFLAGSTQDPEERLAVETFRALELEFPELRLVIVPRHPHRFNEVASLLERTRLAWRRRSELKEEHADNRTGARILLVDTIGELGGWWGTAAIGFVGGSLYSSRGGQNMIEPAAYGAAVCFGPNTQNFRDVVELMLRHNAAFRVEDGEALADFVRRCLEYPGYAKAFGERAAKLVAGQQGAAQRTWRLLERLMSEGRPAAACSPRGAKQRQAA